VAYAGTPGAKGKPVWGLIARGNAPKDFIYAKTGAEIRVSIFPLESSFGM
jgi:hypothetical protein